MTETIEYQQPIDFGHTIHTKINYTRIKKYDYNYKLTITNSQETILYTEQKKKPFWHDTKQTQTIIKQVLNHYKFPLQTNPIITKKQCT